MSAVSLSTLSTRRACWFSTFREVVDVTAAIAGKAMAARSVAIVVFIPLLQLKYIYNREPQFGDSKIIGVSFLHSETAFATGVFVIPHVGIAGTDLRLLCSNGGKVPTDNRRSRRHRQRNYLITGAFTASRRLSPLTKPRARKIDIGGVQLPSHGVHTKKNDR